MRTADLEEMEIDLLLQAINHRYGYDFSGYARASLKRRIENFMNKSEDAHISDMISKIIYDPHFFKSFAFNVSVVVTEMFRDPFVYKAIREKIVPYLKTYPFFKIWHAGCATGEEVYSIAILLKEEGLYDRAQIYGTDFNDITLNKAQEGIYPIDKIKQYTENYQKSGGKASFSDYYYSKYDSVIFNQEIKKNITFANHNLTIDSSFGEMVMIICRNVLIYFDKTLQNSVLSLFHKSLVHDGFLCLGTKETIQFSDVSTKFECFLKDEKVFRKKVI